MDVRIETFLNLYKTMNYHETARQLNMTQPTVTQHIKSLEAEYNCRFFVYDHRKLYKTKEAEIYESYARSVVFNREKLFIALNQPKIRRYRIGATKSIGEYMITDMTAKFLADTSRTADITVANTSNLLKMIDNAQIDFALIEGEFNKGRYASKLFKNEPLCGICSNEHRFAGKTMKLEDIFDETFILREQGSGTRAIFSDILNQHGYSIDDFPRVITVSEFSLLSGLIVNNVGISFVYNAVAQHSQGISTFFIDKINPMHELNYVYLKDSFAESVVEEYCKYETDF